MKADFFTSLASQVLGAVPGIHPLLPPRYATWPGALNTAEAVTAPENAAAAEEGAASFFTPLVDPHRPSIHVPVPTFRQMADPAPSPQPASGMDETPLPEMPNVPVEEIPPEVTPSAPLIQAQYVRSARLPTPPETPAPDANCAPTAPEPVRPLSSPSTIARKPAAWPVSLHSPDRKARGTPVETGETRTAESEYPAFLKPKPPAHTAMPPEPVPNRAAPLKPVIDPVKPVLSSAQTAVPPVEIAAAGVKSEVVHTEHPAAPPLPPIPNRVEALQAQPEDVVTRPGSVPYQPKVRRSYTAPAEKPTGSALPQSIPFSPASQPEAQATVPAESRAPDRRESPLPQAEPSNADTIQRQTLPTVKPSSPPPIQPAPPARTVQPFSPATRVHSAPEKPMRNPISVETIAPLREDAPAEPVIRPLSEAAPLMAHRPESMGARRTPFTRPEPSAPEPIPTVSVSIGRVVVRASFEPELPPPAPVKLPQPPLSLGDYLKNRQKGGR